MKRLILFALAILILGACSTKEIDFQVPIQDDVMFYASFEQPADIDTKVYANEDLLLRWTADDRVSIFNKLTYNQEYKFTGQTGANAGGFKKVDYDEFVTGNAISHVVSVYPYQETTTITEGEVINLTLPAEQKYAENTFGLGANTMVSISDDNVLQYKNVGGYLMFKLYGEGVSVSSISLKGNNGERLAGLATVSIPLGGLPSVNMTNDAGKEVTLVCDTPIRIGTTPETATAFWLVVPPTAFTNGFTLTVKDHLYGIFEKKTTKSIEVSRNALSKMSAIEVLVDPPGEAIVFADQVLKERLVANYDTNGDGELSYKEAASLTSIEQAVRSIKTVVSFDELQFFTGLTSDLSSYFTDWASLVSIVLPDGISGIGSQAFQGCSSLQSIVLPDNISYISIEAFNKSGLTDIIIPAKVKSIGESAFKSTPIERVILPEGLERIGRYAFQVCKQLNSITFPKSLLSIGDFGFDLSGLQVITCLSTTPPTIGRYTFQYCPINTIYVPAESVDAYKYDVHWCYYADYIQAIP